MKNSPEHQLKKDQVFDIYHQCFKDVPDDYEFVIQSNTDTFPKGSQIYLCYGRMSNRDALKRYGFCLTYNKYNHMSIKLRLEQNDPDFRYRHYVLQKFFSVDSNVNNKSDDLDLLQMAPQYDNSLQYFDNEIANKNEGEDVLANLGDFQLVDV